MLWILKLNNQKNLCSSLSSLVTHKIFRLISNLHWTAAPLWVRMQPQILRQRLIGCFFCLKTKYHQAFTVRAPQLCNSLLEDLRQSNLWSLSDNFSKLILKKKFFIDASTPLYFKHIFTCLPVLLLQFWSEML